jgi:hypothetical protein
VRATERPHCEVGDDEGESESAACALWVKEVDECKGAPSSQGGMTRESERAALRRSCHG